MFCKSKGLRWLATLITLCGFVGATQLSRDRICERSCAEVCAKKPSTALLCEQSCVRLCESDPTLYGNPYFRCKYEFDLPEEDEVTGSASPFKPQNPNIYFTTLRGKVYHYNVSSGILQMIYQVSPHLLSSGNGTGLYDITFNLNYDQNSLLYLHYASPPVNHSDHERSYMDAMAKDKLNLHHYNVIQEFQMKKVTLYNNAVVDTLEPGMLLRRIPQMEGSPSGGYLHYGSRIPLFPTSTSTLSYSLGGNDEHSVEKVKHGSYLSTILQLIPEDPSVKDRLFASGIGQPIDCTETTLLLDKKYCILRFGNTSALFFLKRSVNYGPPQYVQLCQDRVCEANRKPGIIDSEPLVMLNETYCPIRSIFMYSGAKMTAYKAHVFAVSDSCYNEKLKIFKPAQILHLQRDLASGAMRLAEMQSDFDDQFLTGTKFIGDDTQDEWFIVGRSMRTRRYVVQRIIPRRAASLV